MITSVGLAFTASGTLMAAIPKLAENEYGRGTGGVLAGTFMACTVASQVAVPRIVRAVRPAGALRFAVVILGAAPILYAVPRFDVAVGATAMRGIGFGLLTVLGPLLTMETAAAERRGPALGVYGVATSLGSVLAVPAGVALVDRDHLHLALLVSAVLAVFALLVAWVGVSPGSGGPKRAAVAPLARPVIRPGLALLGCFFLAAAANANATTFIAVFVPVFGPAALLAGGLARSASRYLIGLAIGPGRLLSALAVTSLVGTAGYVAIPLIGSRALVVPAVVVAGVGAGGVATLTLVATMDASREHEWASSSTAWNVAFNSGMAFGSFFFTTVLAFVDYRGAFLANSLLAAGASAIAVTLAVRDRRRGPRPMTRPLRS